MLLDGDATGAEGDLAARTVVWEERGREGERGEERGERREEREKRAVRQKYGRSEEEEWRRIHTQTTHTQYTHTLYTQYSTMYASYPHHNTLDPA